jgi:hypothetical protein
MRSVSPGALENRVRREFEEIPGVSLTLAQAGRLFGLSAEVCEQVLSSLVSEGVIAVSTDRRYAITPKSA